MMRVAWWILGILLAVSEVALHCGDFHIPLDGGYALMTAPGDPSTSVLTFRYERVAETIVAYDQPGPKVVLLQIDDGQYAIARDGRVSRFDDATEWSRAIETLLPGHQANLQEVSRLDDPDYQRLQAVLLIGIAFWCGTGIVFNRARGRSARVE